GPARGDARAGAGGGGEVLRRAHAHHGCAGAGAARHGGPAMNTQRFFARSLAVLCLGFSGLAAAAIPIEHWVHGSGTRVYLVNSPSIPMVDVQMDFDGGSRRESAAQAGLANATAGLLAGGVEAYEGLPARDENQLAAAWVDLGAQFGASAGS